MSERCHIPLGIRLSHCSQHRGLNTHNFVVMVKVPELSSVDDTVSSTGHDKILNASAFKSELGQPIHETERSTAHPLLCRESDVILPCTTCPTAWCCILSSAIETLCDLSDDCFSWCLDSRQLVVALETPCTFSDPLMHTKPTRNVVTCG